MREVLITTTDNPYDPYLEPEEWYKYDTQVLGYNTWAYIARIAYSSSDIPEADQENDRETAIDKVCRYNVTGKYKKLVYVDGKLQN